MTIVELAFFPSKFSVTDLLFRTDTLILFKNTGTYDIPVYGNMSVKDESPLFGDATDGDVVISSNTDLGAANDKNYDNLTINAGITLDMNSAGIIRVQNTLQLDGNLICDDGAAGGVDAVSDAGDGGPGGGSFQLQVATIKGTGSINVNGIDGFASSGQTGDANGASGTDGSLRTDTHTGGGGGGSGIGHGGGGGGYFGKGATGVGVNGGPGGVALTSLKDIPFDFYNLPTSKGSGGGEGGINTNVRGGGGGGGSGGLLLIEAGLIEDACTIAATGGTGGLGSGSSPAQGGGGGGGFIFMRIISSSNAILDVSKGGGATPAEDGISVVYF